MTAPMTFLALDHLKKAKPILVDTNILYAWMPIPGEQPNSSVPGDVLAEIVSKGVPVLINSHVLSEYINLYVRNYAHAHKSELNGDLNTNYGYKHNFRNTDIYERLIQNAVEVIYDFLDNQGLDIIYSDTKDNLTKEALTIMTQSRVDFTDAMLFLIALQHGASILTNDSDLSKLDIPGISAPSILTAQ